jgi:hypothetical protein
MNLPKSDSYNCLVDVSIATFVTMAQAADQDGNASKALALLERARTIAIDSYGDDSISVATISQELRAVSAKIDHQHDIAETCTHLSAWVQQSPPPNRCS